jgi:hypothetical protein
VSLACACHTCSYLRLKSSCEKPADVIRRVTQSMADLYAAILEAYCPTEIFRNVLICAIFRALIRSIIYEQPTKYTSMFVMYFIHNFLTNMFRPVFRPSSGRYYYKNTKVQMWLVVYNNFNYNYNNFNCYRVTATQLTTFAVFLFF